MQVDINRKKTEYLITCIDQGMVGETFSIHIYFPNRKWYVAMIRDSLRHLFSHYKIGSDAVQRMVTVADEIMNNTVTYGSAEWDVNQFRISLVDFPHEVRITYEIQDTGRNHDSRTAAQMHSLLEKNKQTWDMEPMRLRGRWYQMITSICDKVEFLDTPRGGLVVRTEATLDKVV